VNSWHPVLCSHANALISISEPLEDILGTDTTAEAPVCAECGKQGHAVPGQTVKALLMVSLRTLISNTYWFCETAGCPIVYFAPDTSHYLTVLDVREVVYQKYPEESATPICYCFRHSVGDVRDGQPEQLQRIIQDITSGIQADQCACDLRNPQGSCCLGNVRRYLRSKRSA
jgi:hypothetical protein